MEKIQSFIVPATTGEHAVPMPPDADVFKIASASNPEAVGPGTVIMAFATVTVDEDGQNVNELEVRSFVVAATGDVLPSTDFPRKEFTRRYVDSVVIGSNAAYLTLHVWEMKRTA